MSIAFRVFRHESLLMTVTSRDAVSVKGHWDLPVGGQFISLLADS